ncbi:MAG: MMPL family transporter, partial [Dehalococcoidia bacterium]
MSARWPYSMVLAPWLVVTAVAAVVVVAGFRIDNSVSVWFAADDPALALSRTVVEVAGGGEWLLVMIRQDGSPADRQADRGALVASLGNLPEVHAVVTADRADGPVRALLRPQEDAHHEALLVQITNDLDRQDEYRERLLAEVRAVVRAHPTVTSLHMAGTPVINGELNRAARRDMMVFVPAIVVLLVVFSLVIFRTWRDTLVLLSVSLGSVIVTMGTLVVTGHALNMVTIMLPTVVIALAVADAVHLIHAFHHARRREPSGAAARQAVRAVAWPCAGTSATTIAGFLAFAGSSVAPIFQLAVFASLGIALAWILTMTVAPALLVTLWHGRQRAIAPSHSKHDVGTRAPWWQRLGQYPRAVAATLLLASGSLLGLGLLKADTDYVAFFRSGTRVPTDYRALAEAGYPQDALTVVVRATSGQGALSPRHAEMVGSLADRLRAVPGVRGVLAPADLPAGPTGGAGLFAMIALTDYTSSRGLFALVRAVETEVARTLPEDLTVTATGTALLWARMDAGVIQTQRESLIIVSVACCLILWGLFRSLRLALLGLAVSVLPVAVVLGIMGWWGVTVNMATVLIAGIAVGLAVDDSIHVVHAWRLARLGGDDASVACESALQAVGPRLVTTSVVVLGA